MFSWNEKLASLKIEDSSFFQFTKSIKKKHSPVPPLKVTNCFDFVYGDREEVDLITSAFLKSHQISNDPTCHSQAVQDSKQVVDQTFSDLEIEKILIDEVKSSIKQLKVKKAPGHDEILNRVLQNFPACGIEFLTEIYNACLKTSYFPTCWKIGKVVAIPKPGKDHSLPGSYRPITLLPTIGKMLEKMILNRMFETENQVLRNQQFGFRAKHSTTQQVLRITESIALRFNANKSTAMTLLDIEKAFDSVWHGALVHKLMLDNFPMYLVKMIVSFLESRESYVVNNGKSSEGYAIPAGVPQGSPLSPFLFNIFINDIPVPKHCKIVIYADDTALIFLINYYYYYYVFII
jgi:Reverse transcriptase (RNA-dependent DNA polymerase)